VFFPGILCIAGPKEFNEVTGCDSGSSDMDGHDPVFPFGRPGICRPRPWLPKPCGPCFPDAIHLNTERKVPWARITLIARSAAYATARRVRVPAAKAWTMGNAPDQSGALLHFRTFEAIWLLEPHRTRRDATRQICLLPDGCDPTGHPVPTSKPVQRSLGGKRRGAGCLANRSSAYGREIFPRYDSGE